MFTVTGSKPWIYPIEYPYKDEPQSYLELVAAETIHVPPLMIGRIPHGIKVQRHGPPNTGCILIQRLSGSFISRALMVDSGPILLDNTDLFTDVFNLSNRMVRVAKGSQISCLICLAWR